MEPYPEFRIRFH